MELNLNNSLCFFDLETTGLSLTNDRIVQIAIIKIDTQGIKHELNLIINPEVHISEENAQIHGITNEIASKHKNFKENSKLIIDFIGNSDLAGYNSNKFDVPFLAEEFLRNGIEFNLADRQFIDVQNIFHKMEQRTLSAAYEFYCQKELNNAHNAIYDTKATMEILLAQISKYKNLENNISFLSNFSKSNSDELVDFAGRLTKNKKGQIIYNFGKHKGKSIQEVLMQEPGYYGWMLDADFPLHTKLCLRQEVERIKNLKSRESESGFEDKLSQLKNKFNSK